MKLENSKSFKIYNCNSKPKTYPYIYIYFKFQYSNSLILIYGVELFAPIRPLEPPEG